MIIGNDIIRSRTQIVARLVHREGLSSYWSQEHVERPRSPIFKEALDRYSMDITRSLQDAVIASSI